MLGANHDIVDDDPAKNKQAKPDSDLIGHLGPERKSPPR